MATYFAKLNNSNVVTQVIVADQSFIDTQSGTWIQTDINGVSPKNYAGVGYTWNSGLGGFIPQKPYDSWILNNSTCQWDSPVPYPNDGHTYTWDENSVNWTLVT